MYNHYIPNGAQYHPVDPPPRGGHSGHHAGPGNNTNRQNGGLGGLLNGLLQGARGEPGNGVSQSVDALLQNFHLENLDTGDILLALIVLFLILEDGDDLDLIITLGLMILFSLGES